MPRIDESEQEVGTETPFIARKVVVKKGISPKQDYLFSDELGRGRFGTVLKCTEKRTSLKLAAKFVSTKQKEERENVEREVDIMKSLQHRRLLQLYDVYDDGHTEMCIITELINGGELFERVIDDDFELTEKVCAIFMRQICEGVEYMHQQLIIHLDMKPENILCVTRTGNRIKLIDFGLARRYDPKKKLQVMFGTPDFASPEVLSYDRVTPAADMWSVGVICYVLLSGLSPFMGNSDLETMGNVTKAIYDFDDESFDPISAEAKDFISKLLVKNPNARLTPAQCLQHKWLAKKGKTTQLSKIKLKKYVVRRRWQKAVNAIMALHRMGAKLKAKSLQAPNKKSQVVTSSTSKSMSSSRSSVVSSSTMSSRTSASSTSFSSARSSAVSSSISGQTSSVQRNKPLSSSTQTSVPSQSMLRSVPSQSMLRSVPSQSMLRSVPSPSIHKIAPSSSMTTKTRTGTKVTTTTSRFRL